jgi:hypothetical protein
VKGIPPLVLLLATLLLTPAPSRAQISGQFMGAEPVPMNGHLFGAYLQASEDFLGLIAQLRLSFYPDIDFGFQGGLTRVQLGNADFTTVKVGGDLRYQVVKDNPLDIAVGGALAIENGDDISVLTLGPTVVLSRTYQVGSGGAFVPYGGVGLFFSNADVLGAETTDFSVPFRFGAEFRFSPELRVTGELQLRASDSVNDDIAFVTGVNLPF